ncbi:MAG TPA: bifunctional riboflavin kinase/FAD synthetase [Cellvibrionaceae bacterium]
MSEFTFNAGARGLSKPSSGCVASIGSFDGIHLGHRALIEKVIARARARGLPAVVVIFEPQPQEYFSPDTAPARLLGLRDKVLALKALGVDKVLCLRFNSGLRNLTADEFVRQVLVDWLDIRHVEVGDDFRFGRDRAGDYAFLAKAAITYGFTLANSPTLVRLGERVSSTRIRTLLSRGELAAAADLLGQPYSISGRVGYGRALARSLGFPTANVHIGHYRRALAGVYAVEVEGPFGCLPGVANIGVKPTIAEGLKPTLEVFILQGHYELYGTRLRVRFLRWIRAEQKFPSIDALKAQIQHDVDAATDFFKTRQA